MDPQTLIALNRERTARKGCAVVTELSTGRDRLVRESEVIPGELGEAMAKAKRSGRAGVVEIEGASYFINVHMPPVRLVVIGAVHITQALAILASPLGMAMEVIDPRTAFATPERFAGVNLFADWPEQVLGAKPLDRWTALVALSHDPKIDDWPLMSALRCRCFYVGALGSRRTHQKRVERFTEAGFGEGELSRISAPVGLDIGASSPAEIALSILADIVAHQRKTDGGQEA